jgi:hypothetical protein
MNIDINTLSPWDLSLTFGGAMYMAKAPTWGELVELTKVQKAIDAAKASGEFDMELEDRLRRAVKLFFPLAVHPAIDGEPWDNIFAAFAALGTYFEAWLKKKQQAAMDAVKPIPAGVKPTT